METTHRVVVDDSRQMTDVDDDSVELIVTSPPYPMIEMWDEVFGELNPRITDLLQSGDGDGAFGLMHAELDRIWEEIARVLVDGGIACINIGDATRKVDGWFRVYQNHARVIDAFESLGFTPLPDILWRKPVNSATKFMGSGMIPPNAYVTLEHEYILVFRNGDSPRSFERGSENRYRAAYFWEERNAWFTDIWSDIRGTVQTLDDDKLRARSAAFPFAIPFRLINMYSVYDDTVLDPFWGTGTTTLAAMVAGRNSMGYERREEFTSVFADRAAAVQSLSEEVVRDRIQRHKAFARSRDTDQTPMAYSATQYGFPVMTRQETEILFYVIDAVEQKDESYVLTHSEYSISEPVEPSR